MDYGCTIYGCACNSALNRFDPVHHMALRNCSELDLPNVDIQQTNLLLFHPWNTPRGHYINSFANCIKSTVTPVIYQRVFAYHRSHYSEFSVINIDGSKRAGTLALES
ncbi:hypothetical protein TNCV_1757631 [Trichonephila clavipes]|nr:hypothetical protein TNCV_1757631 [Trichonephila clavipes]